MRPAPFVYSIIMKMGGRLFSFLGMLGRMVGEQFTPPLENEKNVG
jgi:hypothetical protein